MSVSAIVTTALDKCSKRDCEKYSEKKNQSEVICQFFKKRGCHVSVVQAGHHRVKQIDRALQTSQKKNANRIPFTFTFHPHNRAVNLLQNDSETGTIFRNLH